MASFNGQQEADGHVETCEATQDVGMKDFERLHLLGYGMTAKVFLVRKVTGPDAGKLYALKQITKEFALEDECQTTYTLTERKVLELVRDDNFFSTMYYAFQTDSMLNLVLEYEHGGELFEQLHRGPGPFTETDARMYIAEVVVALEKLHKLSFVYRDLKPENILLDPSGHVKLADFGLCKDFRNCKVRRAFSLCGTVQYMAPEHFDESGHSYTADWWALGILTYELLTGICPFSSEDPTEDTDDTVADRILNKELGDIPGPVSSCMNDFVHRLLDKDAMERLGSNGAQEIKSHRMFEGIDWAEVAERKLTMPFVPSLESATDMSNFSADCTGLPVEEAVGAVPTEGNDIFKDYAFTPPTKTPKPTGSTVLSDSKITVVSSDTPTDITIDISSTSATTIDISSTSATTIDISSTSATTIPTIDSNSTNIAMDKSQASDISSLADTPIKSLKRENDFSSSPSKRVKVSPASIKKSPSTTASLPLDANHTLMMSAGS